MISSYVLEIEASDHGVPVRSSTVLVNIDITDANDNPPMFAEDNYTVYVQEDKDFGYIVARFSGEFYAYFNFYYQQSSHRPGNRIQIRISE